MAKQPRSKVASKGGKARAESLSPAERQEAARNAADARWKIPKATHIGEINLAGLVIKCAVLEDGRRLLNQQSFLAAIGRRGNPDGAKTSSGDGQSGFLKVPPFLAADNLKPYIGETLSASCNPIPFRLLTGGRFHGYEARLLPLVCEVYLAARRANALTHKQVHIAEACEMLVSALAQTGIVALVDEATGYQEVRDRKALQAILDRYLLQHFAAWAKRFPDDFYKHMFRLKGWKWTHMNPAGGPRCVAQMTKDIVYARLGPGVLEELETRNPVGDNGRRKAAHHQWLTDEIGHPALSEHIKSVVTLMKAVPDKGWDQFARLLDRALPKCGHSIQLDIDDILPEDDSVN